ncbi:HNH endonuclease [Stutzerimonas sp. NM35]
MGRRKKHSSDTRIVNAGSTNDEIHLFYREIHHTPFVYYGQIHLKKYSLLTEDSSQFIFSVGNETHDPDIFDDIESHKDEYKTLDKTERDSIVKSRIGQGLFRDNVIAFWGGCAVTGLSNLSLLRASHIKPWRDSSNHERLDPINGLLLQPTLDHLFDMGLISFDKNGKVIFSPALSKDDIEKLELTDAIRLRKLPVKMVGYLKYHRSHVFKKC